MDNISFAS